MIDANEDKIITKKECEDAVIFNWTDSHVSGDGMMSCARDTTTCRVYCKVWNEVYQRYEYFVVADFSLDCQNILLGRQNSPGNPATKN